MKPSHKSVKEWFKQAKYDLATADAMFKAGRYIYTVFMCHLAIEKALKGLYSQSLKKYPPRTHSLVYLTARVGLKLPNRLKEFVERLDNLSVPTRYPGELGKMLKEYDRKRTKNILINTRGLLKWLEQKLQR